VTLIHNVALVSAVLAVATTVAGDDRADEPDPSWLDRLGAEDRGCLDRSIGYAPPAFPGDATWYNTEPLTWRELRGRVVLIQSWSCATAGGRNLALNASRLVAGQQPEDVQVIALHTPQGADAAAAFLDRGRISYPVIVDREGAFCDALGVFERPVNVLVDRNGVVRYAGLNQRGLKKAVAQLVAEPHDPEAIVPVRTAAPDEPQVEFPKIEGCPRGAVDFRGRRAPPMHVAQWINGRPDAGGKVTVIEFWATWCPPCRASIPHLNELADEFRDEVVCVGLSDEQPNRFRQGLDRYHLSLDMFHYAVALDPAGRMKGQLKIRGIPYAMVVSSDWIVRWQGHPATLRASTLSEIVRANRALDGAGEPRCSRWTEQ
jgi:thiol-disulfide isomerase/thioredoxin